VLGLPVVSAGTAQAAPGVVVAPRPLVDKVLVIAHRGASGYRPEHTLAAYRLAVQQGADAFDVDLVSSRDHQLVALHDLELSSVTDVAAHPEFADRRTTKTVDGVSATGWFVDDFTVAELKTLRVRERMPSLRPQNTAYDGQFEIPTFAEVLALRAELQASTGRSIVVYPELKAPTYFRSVDLELEAPLAAALKDAGLDTATAPAWVQCFEPTSLARLRDTYGLRTRMTFLTGSGGRPYDFVASGDPRTYADLLTPSGLSWLARFVSAIGPEQAQVLPRRADGTLGSPTTLVARVHAAGLMVHVYALRSENAFLPVDYRVGTNRAANGRAVVYDSRLLQAGVDGTFCDQPDLCVAARAQTRPHVARTWSPRRR
jgi:glycerophosphoryl diester phosphodiesterase